MYEWETVEHRDTTENLSDAFNEAEKSHGEKLYWYDERGFEGKPTSEHFSKASDAEAIGYGTDDVDDDWIIARIRLEK